MSPLSIGSQFARPSRTLADIEIFRHCSPATLDTLENQALIKHVTRNRRLFTQDEDAEFFYLIEYGLVKVFKETNDGNKTIFDIIPGGHMFGETILPHDPKYKHSAESISTAALKLYPLAVLHDELKSNHDFSTAMHQNLSRTNFLREMEIEHRTLQTASQKICCFMLRLYGTKEPGHVTLQLPYDKTLIALRLGMEPETFSRALFRLKADTGIEIHGDIVEIPDMDRLTNYSCKTCSLIFPCGT